MGYPALTRMGVIPMSADPDVTPAFPIPVASQPHIARGRRRPVFLYSGWRRLDGDDRADIVPVRGWRNGHDTPSQCGR
jgi:hypothetical protein